MMLLIAKLYEGEIVELNGDITAIKKQSSHIK